jgi:predicted nucleotide-binding protein
MAKPTLFIGSSTENKNLALAVQSSLQYDVFPVVWTQGTFEPSHFALESLEGALDIADFAVLVCAPDDLTTIREQQYATVRDNVIFELGMFIGRLSRKRTFLISPRGVELHLPSDLNGISPETFDPEQLSNPEAALGPARATTSRQYNKRRGVRWQLRTCAARNLSEF